MRDYESASWPNAVQREKFVKEDMRKPIFIPLGLIAMAVVLCSFIKV